VASDCGYTDNHYSRLKQLHNHYSATGKFTVLAFPCNQFGRQEPGVSRLTTTYAISAYHHRSCEFEPRSWRGVLDTT
jgi:glutathione peroxidase